MIIETLLGGLAAGLITYGAVSLGAARRLAQGRRRLPAVEPSDVGLAYEDVWLQARGERLNIAAWHIPAAGAARAVIIAHGIGGCRGHEFTVSSLELMRGLVQHGFTVLAIDLRGHGESDEAPMTYGIRERRDVLGAVGWLLARGYAPGAIGVLGLSMGGVAGIGAAAEEPAIGALVADSACADLLAVLSAHFPRASGLPRWFLPGALLIGERLIGERLRGMRPAEVLQASPRRPTLIIHGGRDRLVPMTHGRALALAAAAELWAVMNAGHLGAFAADPYAYTRRVIEHFDDALVRRPVAQPIAATTEPELAGAPISDQLWLVGR